MIDVKTDPKAIPDNLPDPFSSPELGSITRLLGATGQYPKQSVSLGQGQLGGSPGSELTPEGFHPVLPMGLEPARDGLAAHFQSPGNLGLSYPFLVPGDRFEATTFKLDGISCCSHSP